jgi:hypothetical protein
MVVLEAAHVKIQAGSRSVSQLEAPKYMTMGPWIQGHPISAIDQTDIEWTLFIASREAPTDW